MMPATFTYHLSLFLKKYPEIPPKYRIEADHRQMKDAKEEKSRSSSHPEEVHHFQTISNLIEEGTVYPKYNR